MFYIDLTDRTPVVAEFDSEHIRSYIAENELSEYDFRTFEVESDADSFLERYNSILKSLDNALICKSRTLPAMLYKRRYIVQSIMRVKSQTFRHYRTSWKENDLVNLHDQTFFLTVKIIRISKIENQWRYDFELV